MRDGSSNEEKQSLQNNLLTTREKDYGENDFAGLPIAATTTVTVGGAGEEEHETLLPFPHISKMSIRGAENFHIYLWILKDLSWAQDWRFSAMFFGSFALAWCSVLLYMAAVKHRNVEEVYMLAALTLWLFGNFWWMIGEVGVLGDDDTNSVQGGHIFEGRWHIIDAVSITFA